jgi:hypothetical protein
MYNLIGYYYHFNILIYLTDFNYFMRIEVCDLLQPNY